MASVLVVSVAVSLYIADSSVASTRKYASTTSSVERERAISDLMNVVD